jgi:GTP-binding protein
MLKRIAVIGRPNVGKSTLFNRFVGRKKAIIHAVAGTTRDRNDHEVAWKGHKFIVTDTAGWSESENEFSSSMRAQLKTAVKKADVILFLTDAKFGVHPFEPQIAKEIRSSEKPVVLVVNKVDTQADENKAYEFYKLGFDNIINISANHGRKINELLDVLVSMLGEAPARTPEEDILKIVMLGKPNVGKSSFVNAIAKEDRCIVHDTPGTTRDSLNVAVNFDGKDYILTDTAGLHKGNKPKDDMDYLSALSTNYAIEGANVAVLLTDATLGIGDTEVKIARLIVEKGKPCVIAVNKWDLIENREDMVKIFAAQIANKLKFLSWADIIFISVKTGQRLDKVFKEADIVYGEYSKMVEQTDLNEVLRGAVSKKPLTRKGKTLKIKEAAQVSTRPPTFRFIVNDMELVHFSYRRYLENRIRKAFVFKGSPIVMKFRTLIKNKEGVY